MAQTGSLTEAFAKGQIDLVMGNANGSNLRTIPYDEIYRESSVQRETPAERVQRIAMAEGEAPSKETAAT